MRVAASLSACGDDSKEQAEARALEGLLHSDDEAKTQARIFNAESKAYKFAAQLITELCRSPQDASAGEEPAKAGFVVVLHQPKHGYVAVRRRDQAVGRDVDAIWIFGTARTPTEVELRRVVQPYLDRLDVKKHHIA